MDNKKVGWFTKFLWLISGVEIWILKDSPTSYTYYARQGLLFLMIFFFAAFSGAFAGYDFGGNMKFVIFFGILWGFLVYSIDQMMIQTIDKVYIESLSFWKKFGYYFFPRLLLGALLALFMSSPLDHYIFRDQIEAQMRRNAEKEWKEYQQQLHATLNIEGTQKQLKEYELKLDSLSRVKNQEPNTYRYREAKKNLQEAKKSLPKLKKDMAYAKRQRNLAWRHIPQYYDTIKKKYIKIRNTPQYRTYLKKNKIYKEVKSKYESKLKEIEQYQKIMNEEIINFEKEITNQIKQTDTIKNNLYTQLEKNKSKIEEKSSEKEKFLSELHGFDTKFMTLLKHPDFGVQFLRWFIFTVFLLIEILPTWMKLMGKPTEYDVKLHLIKQKRMKSIEKEFQKEEQMHNIKITNDIQILEDKERLRKDEEIKLYRKILDNITQKYENITNKLLKEWEEKILKNKN